MLRHGCDSGQYSEGYAGSKAAMSLCRLVLAQLTSSADDKIMMG